ncbi:MAG: disulfide oxidoreductase [Rhodospirillales bacterium]|nr:disulfide oxidoreductase [Alphaproteobacteria bacterium]MBL6947096.1 disulfide oxidoreductase [Rhodospirillales bacterium]
MQIDTTLDRPRIVAVLGPTNTGKTHLAMERMLGHASGIIGFPLRLLARENYDRAVAIKGRSRVALITGEEKIIPPGAQYFLCTVESMPLDHAVAFVGIDEIQMCADPDRGHIFTDRLLYARGRHETMFMGADTIRPLLRRLVDNIEFESRPRLSTLTYSGAGKTARLKPRSAVVAFNASEVYALAEQLRRHRGGAAVVLGALSPRTRNAQVAMYQDGEVDYLVATDAIGMGLNMDVGHVAFAATRKFDGRRRRPLSAAELAQTAGRAGRYMNDGTFGVTGNAAPLDADVVERIENHRFDALEFLFWRNPELDFSSLERLQRSLAEPARIQGLVRGREADDELALRHLAEAADIARLAATPVGLRLLWDVCRIPDFGQIRSEAHAGLLADIYRHLMGPDGGGDSYLPTDWLAARVNRLDNTSGDIETLAGRIAGIRIWTYVAYQPGWLRDAAHWQDTTRIIEDKLSDALHRGLTQRFVDKRTAVLVSRIKEREDLLAAVKSDGEVVVEGHYMGRLDGFRFQPDDAVLDDRTAAKKVANAAVRALRGEAAARLRRLVLDGDDNFRLSVEGDGESRILWRDQAVAGLKAGSSLLKPAVEPLPGNLLETASREQLRRRLQVWLDGYVESVFASLTVALSGPALTGPARGLVFQLGENLGSIPRDLVAGQVDGLGRAGRKILKSLGVRIGRHWLYLPVLLKPRAVELRALLWGLWNGAGIPPPPPGRVSVAVDDAVPGEFYASMGYARFARLAVRCDMVERLASAAWTLARKGPFALSEDAGAGLMSLAGCGADEMAGILAGLGYRGCAGKDGVLRFGHAKTPVKKPANKSKRVASDGKKRRKANPDSPFAALQNLTVER